jgi:hypothetical protein
MNGWRLVAPALALLGTTSLAFAQDTIVTAPKAKPATAAPTRAPKAIPTATAPAAKPEAQDPQVRQAQEMASIATREATCLREAAQHVNLAAQRVSTASPETMEKRRQELQFQLGVMQECRNIARKREVDADAGPFAEPPPAEAPLRSLFSFGKIFVESGKGDAAVMANPLRQHAERFARCQSRAKSPRAHGTVQMVVRMVQGAGGGARPSTVAIPGATLRDRAVHRCLASALMDTSFPKSLAGSDVSLTMAFSQTR